MMIDEGYIKYNIHWQQGPALPAATLAPLMAMRQQLYALKLIGAYPDGIGYGNISMRHQVGTFVVSGTATGGFATSTPNHYTVVTAYDLAANSLHCQGPVKASSESLTHAALYACSPAIGAVIHVHHRQLWQALLHTVPTTPATVAYGTPAMALAMAQLYGQGPLAQQGILAMAGHEEGIITFGQDLGQAFERLMAFFLPYK